MLDKYQNLLNQDIPNSFYKYTCDPTLLNLKNRSYFCGMDYASKDIIIF